ncbi:MAG: YihY/virulence factor BrkB family protein [Desulfobacteraceae bacterium]|jgi:membrane protein
MLKLRRRQTFFYRSFAIAFQNFVRNDCTTISSSISFVFLLAIIPFSALFLFILNLFQNIFLPELVSNDMVSILVEDINRLIPFVPKSWVRSHLVDSVGLGSFTTINIVMLPIISGLLFKSLDQAFRKIFNLPRRGLIKGQAVYAAMSIFAIVSFFMFNFIWTLASDTTWQLQEYIESAAYLNDLYTQALELFSFSQVNLISWLILVLFFLITAKLFLHTEIRLRHRLIAGALFGVLWIAAREGFGLYIRNVAPLNVLFGSLGSVCIVLIWVHYSSMALLYSVEFMFVLHGGPYKIWDREHRRA